MADPSRSFYPKVASFVTNHHDTYPVIDPRKSDLSGKSVFITGASKGIGRAAGTRFAIAGCSKIAIGARSPLSEVESEIKAASKAAGHPEPQVLALQLDVSSEESVRAAAAAYEKTFGPTLDVLINNAGYLEKWLPVAESDPGEWWHSWEVNVKGTYLMNRYFLPLVLRSESIKTVINLSSAGGHNVSHGASAYQTARMAACRLTEHIERENREKGLIVVAVHPGSIKTELAQNMPEHMHSILIDEVELPGDFWVWVAKERREWLSGRFVSACWDVEELVARKDEIVEKDLLKFRMVI